MSEPTGPQHHAIDYVELSAPDLPAARAFYEQAFDWTFTEYGPEYLGIQGVGREQGGIAIGDAPPLVQLYSDDLDATLAAVRAAGGTITVEPFDFPGGRRFAFADPAGNQLGVWTAAPE
ncbi:VOC family protein [Agrococcus jejuensis]|uniref:VOC domain-containing protein n=1 Tax=Agrococcus jejuensis TaxID=399736 RepID=A0A1G8CQ87_9MICO|nr:VOC family protein [Agrococcus jejuensis]SDH47596.1 hypothetical protein SAMN04489720_1373 [Agrococcus jejuensis]